MKKYIKYKNNYIVSDHGEVWKITNKGLKKKKLSENQRGYLITDINGKLERVHRIVMCAFKGSSTLQVDHLDCDKSNNNLSNLEYVTNEENARRAHLNGLYDEGYKKRTKKIKKKVLYRGKVFNSAKELSLSLGLKSGTCSAAIRQECKLKGYPVEYV